MATDSDQDSASLLQSRSPARPIKQFALPSIVSVLAILLFAGFGIYRIYGDDMVRVAEETATYVGNSTFEQERRTLLKINENAESMSLSPGDFDRFDASMRTFLRTFNMHKIKIFSAGKTIVYSTDRQIIGMTEDKNVKLDAALATGQVVSDLQVKDEIRDLRGESRFNVDVVETYVPIHGGQGTLDDPIVGTFEVYVDVSSMNQRIGAAVKSTVLILSTILMVVFSLLFLVMLRGTTALKRVQNDLHQFAAIDALTGVFNRRQVLLRLHEVQARVQRESRIRGSLRPYDLLGRYGGEEFLVVCPDMSLQDAIALAERIGRRISQSAVTCKQARVKLTLRIGVATIDPPDEDINKTIRRADEGLYQAKKQGRNQVCTVAR